VAGVSGIKTHTVARSGCVSRQSGRAFPHVSYVPTRAAVIQAAFIWRFACAGVVARLSKPYTATTHLPSHSDTIFPHPCLSYARFPVFVILDHRGSYIHTQSAGPLEVDPIFTAEDPDPNKLLTFLNYWKAGGLNDELAAEGVGSVSAVKSSLLSSSLSGSA
jgi:hypothetical protein